MSERVRQVLDKFDVRERVLESMKLDLLACSERRKARDVKLAEARHATRVSEIETVIAENLDHLQEQRTAFLAALAKPLGEGTAKETEELETCETWEVVDDCQKVEWSESKPNLKVSGVLVKSAEIHPNPDQFALSVSLKLAPGNAKFHAPISELTVGLLLEFAPSNGKLKASGGDLKGQDEDKEDKSKVPFPGVFVYQIRANSLRLCQGSEMLDFSKWDSALADTDGITFLEYSLKDELRLVCTIPTLPRLGTISKVLALVVQGGTWQEVSLGTSDKRLRLHVPLMLRLGNGHDSYKSFVICQNKLRLLLQQRRKVLETEALPDIASALLRLGDALSVKIESEYDDEFVAREGGGGEGVGSRLLVFYRSQQQKLEHFLEVDTKCDLACSSRFPGDAKHWALRKSNGTSVQSCKATCVLWEIVPFGIVRVRKAGIAVQDKSSGEGHTVYSIKVFPHHRGGLHNPHLILQRCVSVEMTWTSSLSWFVVYRRGYLFVQFVHFDPFSPKTLVHVYSLGEREREQKQKRNMSLSKTKARGEEHGKETPCELKPLCQTVVSLAGPIQIEIVLDQAESKSLPPRWLCMGRDGAGGSPEAHFVLCDLVGNVVGKKAYVSMPKALKMQVFEQNGRDILIMYHEGAQWSVRFANNLVDEIVRDCVPVLPP